MNLNAIKQFMKEKGREFTYTGKVPVRVQRELFGEFIGPTIFINLVSMECGAIERDRDGQLIHENSKQIK